MDGIDEILDLLQRLQRDVHENVRSTPGPPLEHLFLPELEKINDSVYSVHSPPGGKRPSVEIVLFPGLQLEGSHDEHITSWVSRDQSKPELWPKWILEDEKLEDARILLISYDAHIRKVIEEGLVHNTSENLILDLIDNAQVGQDGCPVILVGHSLGGLLMKELCVQAQVTLSLQDKTNNGVQNFLANVQGFLCYGSPHHGTELARVSIFWKGPLFKGPTTLHDETARRNEKFRTLRQKYEWRTLGIGELLPVNLYFASQGKFKDLVVEEASARHDVDVYHSQAVDHFDVCRPQSRNSQIFVMLKNFVSDTVEKGQDRHSLKMCTPKGIYGLEERVNDILQRLNKGARRLGIVGMVGIGKTTLAEVVYHTISGTFEYTCFSRDMKTLMASRDNLEHLRKKIINDMYYRGRKVKDTFNWKTLQGKRVLIVLDDVEHRSQVQVMLQSDCFLEESCVVATSRESKFLQTEDFECYFVEQLDKEDSKKMFCVNAFGYECAAIGYEYCMEQFLKKCGGWPLALKVVGKFLYGQGQGVWHDGLEKLKHAKSLNGSREDGLWSILRVCYDSLVEVEQEMFLDVATGFHDQDLEKVKQAWRVCGWASSYGLKNLKDKGLVTMQENVTSLPRQEHIICICMHPLLRDLGRSIACPSTKTVGTHTRLCYDLSNPLPTTELFDEGNPQVKVLIIDRCEEISTQSLHGLKNLRILWLEDVSFRGPLDLLPTNLTYLKITDSSLSIQPEGSHSESTGAGVSPELREKRRKILRQHSALKRLEINSCTLLEGSLDSLDQCQALEQLEISDLSNWTAIPENLGELRALKDLRVVSCDQLESVPNSVGHLLALKYLVIQDCDNIKAIPDSLGRLGALEHLVVSCGCCKAPPHVLRQLKALRHFETTCCQDWEDLLDSLGQLEALQYIAIHHCIDHYYRTIDQLQLLESLTKRSLLQGIGQVDLPMFHLDYVQIIRWKSELLPSNFVGVGRARSLVIKDCGNLKALPNTLGSLQVLEHLKIVNCGSLEALPDSIGELKALQSLSIEGCEGLRALPDTLGELRALIYVKIESCRHLNSLPETIGKLEALEHLCIEGCDSLGALPDSLGKLRALRQLTIDRCQSLQALPVSLGQLQSLKHLKIVNCASLEDLPESIGLLSNLKELTIQDCESLSALPVSLGQQSLKHLKIVNCASLEDLPESIGSLSNLKDLTIQDCESLSALPVSLGQLQSLEHLKIVNCASLEDLPESIGSLSNLKDLAIQDCKSLSALPESLGELKSLARLTIQGCRSLKTLPESLRRLQGLEHLLIKGCCNLEALLENFRGEVRKGEEDGFFVSIDWLRSLKEHEQKDLMLNLRKSGYSETSQTATTILFARIEIDVRHEMKNEDSLGPVTENNVCPRDPGEGGAGEGGNDSTGRAGSSIDRKRRRSKEELSPASDPHEDKGSGSVGVVYTMDTSGSQVSSSCHPQDLMVDCSSPQTLRVLPETGFWRQKQFGDGLVVKMPRTVKSRRVSTITDGCFDIEKFTFREGSGVEIPVKMKATAQTSVSCCLRTDQGSPKVRIKVHVLRGEVKKKDANEDACNLVVLRSICTNVYCCIKSGDTEDCLEEIVLKPEEEYCRQPRLRVVPHSKADSTEVSTSSEDFVYLAMSAMRPENHEGESIAIELTRDVEGRRKAYQQTGVQSRILYFDDRYDRPVIFEGEISVPLQQLSILEIHVRYQIEVSYYKAFTAIHNDIPWSFCRWNSKSVDFDCCLEIKTENILLG